MYHRYRRDDFDLERERAEAACDAAQDQQAREIEAELAKRTPAQVQAEEMRAYEDACDLKGLPIGITRARAIRRGLMED